MADNFESLRDMIREEFKAAFVQLSEHEKRIAVLELWRQRQEGYAEGAGSIHTEVKDLRAKVQSLESSLSEVKTQRDTVGKGLPWAFGVVGGVIGIVGALFSLFQYLSTRGG